MAVQIKIDQAAKPAGVAGVAREDLDLATAVTLTAVGGPFSQYKWTIVDKPPNAALTAPSAATLTAPSAATTQTTPDNTGTYMIQLAVDAGFGLGARPEDVARITFYAGPALNPVINQLPRRVPSFLEKLEHNVPDSIDPTGNLEGWAREWRKWFKVIESFGGGLTPPGGGDDYKVAFGLSNDLAYATGIKVVSGGAQDQLQFGTTPATTGGDLRFTGAFTLATKVGGTDYFWTYGASTFTMPADGNLFLTPAARTTPGTGFRVHLKAGGGSGTNQDGGELRLSGGEETGTGTKGFVSFFNGSTQVGRFDLAGYWGTASSNPRILFSTGGTIESVNENIEIRPADTKSFIVNTVPLTAATYIEFVGNNLTFHGTTGTTISKSQNPAASFGRDFLLVGQGAGAGSAARGGRFKIVTGNPDTTSGSERPGDLEFWLGLTWTSTNLQTYAEVIQAPDNTLPFSDVRSFRFIKRHRHSCSSTSLEVAWSIPYTDLIPSVLEDPQFHVVILWRLVIMSWSKDGISQTGTYYRRGMAKIWDNAGTPTLVVTNGPTELANGDTLGLGVQTASHPDIQVGAGTNFEVRLTPRSVADIHYDVVLECVGFHLPPP